MVYPKNEVVRGECAPTKMCVTCDTNFQSASLMLGGRRISQGTFASNRYLSKSPTPRPRRNSILFAGGGTYCGDRGLLTKTCSHCANELRRSERFGLPLRRMAIEFNSHSLSLSIRKLSAESNEVYNT